MVQLLPHDTPLQTYAPQPEVVGALHAPRPSQYAADFAVPAVHDAAAQTWLEPGGAPQAERVDPLQVAAQMPVPVQAAFEPCGLPLTAVQVPSAPPTSQASHC